MNGRLILSAFRLAFEDRIPGGKADNLDINRFDPMALYKGLLVELEHTNDPWIALEIAMDHLTESPEYYDALEKMEQQLEAK